MTKLMIIVPAYNEQEVLKSSIERLWQIENELKKSQQITMDSGILIVDDGSVDQTWPIIEQLHQKQPAISGLRFSRNFGHQAALLAGLTTAVWDADVMITIDADLQDDPEKIPAMIEQYQAGCEIVYGVRSDRQTDSWFKRNTAELFYGLMHKMGVTMIPDSADFRLLSNRAVHALLKYSERGLFLRGLVPQLGFQTGRVEYRRTPRLAGKTKYSLKKMVGLALNGITSLTSMPLRLIFWLGMLVCMLAIGMGIFTLTVHLLGKTMQGWSSLMLSLWFIGGVQLMSIGVIGEYLSKVLVEVKHRPRFIVDQHLK